jgi:hypothetical protein
LKAEQSDSIEKECSAMKYPKEEDRLACIAETTLRSQQYTDVNSDKSYTTTAKIRIEKTVTETDHSHQKSRTQTISKEIKIENQYSHQDTQNSPPYTSDYDDGDVDNVKHYNPDNPDYNDKVKPYGLSTPDSYQGIQNSYDLNSDENKYRRLYNENQNFQEPPNTKALIPKKKL